MTHPASGKEVTLVQMLEARGGPCIISNATFPSYFLKEETAVTRGHALLDLAVFEKIASALKNGDFDLLRTLVPDSVYQYFTSPEAEPVLRKIQHAESVIHY